MTVRIEGNKVKEIIPEYALPVEKWYGKTFAAQCVEAPNDVEEGWWYHEDTGTFSSPSSSESFPEPKLEITTHTADSRHEKAYPRGVWAHVKQAVSGRRHK